MAPSPTTELRIKPKEKRELQAMAEQAGIPLSVAMRRGARVYLGTLIDSAEMKRGRPKAA
jgi:hypothetical protein